MYIACVYVRVLIFAAHILLVSNAQDGKYKKIWHKQSIVMFSRINFVPTFTPLPPPIVQMCVFEFVHGYLHVQVHNIMWL